MIDATQCPECISGALRSTVQKIASAPYKDLRYDSVDRMLSEVCNTVAGFIKLAEAYVLAAKTKQGETRGAAEGRKWRHRQMFKGGMAPRLPRCAGCIGDSLRKVVRNICSGMARDLGYFIGISKVLDEIYDRMASYLELAEKFAFITSAWSAQSVTCSSALCRGWDRRQWERYVGKGRGAGLGWLAREGLVTKGQRGWMWAPGVTLEKVLAADTELRAFAEMRRQREIDL